MQVIDQGHKYQLQDGQELRFIKKVKNEKTGTFDTVWVGTTNEELLEVLIDRTTALNAKLNSPENAVAIHHMEAALEVFNARTRARQKQGVEGTPLSHLPSPGAAAKTAGVLIGTSQLKPAEAPPHTREMLKYINGGKLSLQEMIDIEGYFSWLRNETTKVPGQDTKAADDVTPVAASLIGAHDGSAFPAGLTSGDRHAAFTQAARQERGDLQPKAAWAFPTPDTGPETNAGDPPCNDPDHPIHDL